MDLDGHTGPKWGNSTDPIIVTPAFDIDGNPSTFTDTELDRIQRIWQRVAEDYAPFNIDITTQDPGSAALMKTSSQDTDWGVRVIVGGDGAWLGSGGGIASVGSFNASVDMPCYIFSDVYDDNEKKVAEAASHEAGHTLGLSHDGSTNPVQDYYGGSGSGPTGWAPIMGVGYGQNLTQWSKGEYPNANNTQDDLAIITTNNGFTYRVDDRGNTIAAASPLAGSGTTFVGAGIIERNTDVDMFSFTTTGGTFGITVDPFVRGPNLDILANLYNAAGTLLATSNPIEALNAVVQATLAAGTYYVSVAGTGKGSPATGGYSNYGSLGQYSIMVSPNSAPVASAGGLVSGSEDQAVTFDASGSFDADGNALSYLWNFGDGTTATTTSATIDHKYLWGGTFVATLTVDDGLGGTGTATTTAVVSEVNDAPLAQAGGPVTGSSGIPVAFSGVGSSDYDNLDSSSTNNQTLVYSWNFGDGTTGTGLNVSHVYTTAGNFTATLTVSDGITSNSAATSVTIAAGNPNNIYVWDIVPTTQKQGSRTNARVAVTVRRDSNANGAAGSNDALLSNASVTVELRKSNGTLIGTASGTTNILGVFTSSWFNNVANGTYVAEVTSITRSGYTWNKSLDPTSNDTDLDSDNLPDQQFVVGSAAAPNRRDLSHRHRFATAEFDERPAGRSRNPAPGVN